MADRPRAGAERHRAHTGGPLTRQWSVRPRLTRRAGHDIERGVLPDRIVVLVGDAEAQLRDRAVVAELDGGITGHGGDVRRPGAIRPTAAVAARAGDDRSGGGVLELERPGGVLAPQGRLDDTPGAGAARRSP